MDVIEEVDPEEGHEDNLDHDGSWSRTHLRQATIRFLNPQRVFVLIDRTGKVSATFLELTMTRTRFQACTSEKTTPVEEA